MPELPDITIYLDALQSRIVGRAIQRIRVDSIFVVRTFDPAIDEAEGRIVAGVERLGKRVVLRLVETESDAGSDEEDLFLVVHLMIAGRFQWKEAGAKIPKRLGLAAFDFDNGTLLLTEAGTKKRAGIFLVRGRRRLRSLAREGIEVLENDLDAFRTVLLRENHTVKRSLTDPRFFSGIGNAYSDEILHHAQLSPLKQTQKMSDEEIERLYESTCTVLNLWIDRLREETGDGFPEKVTAFRKDMAVHGKFGKPCPVCESPVQRIQYASNETNYCARCQTGGKILADRSLSRLLKGDWPKTLEELED